MPSPYDRDAFATRVNFAASYIAAGRRTTRTFDTCCEMYDGDAVAVAVYRRSRKTPKLRANLWRYFSRDYVLPIAFRERRRRDLTAWAADLRREGDLRFAAMLAEQDARQAKALATEPTDQGLQYVIPGCEKDKTRGPKQMDLF